VVSDRLYPLPIERLVQWLLSEEPTGYLLGIHRDLFFVPDRADPFRLERYGQWLETPIGVAAGPHTQLAQNIVAAWLTGARYIELKTVQTLDRIEVAKPCIDMEDEGYNCEWSQELSLEESFDEYLKAWILIHLLKDRFGWGDPEELGTIFNMSVGYDLAGIQQPNVQRFLDHMTDAGERLEEQIEAAAGVCPRIRELAIPRRISDNVTLSTMHGCPPQEIEQIGRYLIEERRLHTMIKLNPTLLGPERVRAILNDNLGFDAAVPDEAFAHDLRYQEALPLIRSLQAAARQAGVHFGLKLTNTLEVRNTRSVLPAREPMTYLSGRALHPISINLAARLQEDFGGRLDLSFCAGVDCFNVAQVLACNLKPVTTCSDLLKPGGYARLRQYLAELRREFRRLEAGSIDDYVLKKNGGKEDVQVAGLENLRAYSQAVLQEEKYRKSFLPYTDTKTRRPLTPFDCIQAPCITACAVEQAVPDYMFFTARGEYRQAQQVILHSNPFPAVTGMVCDHLCQTKCTRIHYDQPLLIRDIKRFIAEQSVQVEPPVAAERNGLRVAIVGAGPSGLACAYFLALAGFEVEVFESRESAGGLVADVIPRFRLTEKAIQADLDRILALGVKIHYGVRVDRPRFTNLRRDYDYVYLALGAQQNRRLGIPGETAQGVLNPLHFLSRVRRGEAVSLGRKVLVIGGGNSAMDAARTAQRLVGSGGEVTVLYRRTRKEMPVNWDEVVALQQEGIELVELVAPVRILTREGRVSGLVCARMRLGKPDASGRPRPVKIPGSEFELAADSIIPAIGQEVILDFLPEGRLTIDPESGETQFPNVFAGGDLVRGADSLINAIGDGKRAAEQILQRAGYPHDRFKTAVDKQIPRAEFSLRQAHRLSRIPVPELDLSRRNGFDLVHLTLAEAEARREAERCLYCDEVCNLCVTVCPNLANVSYTLKPGVYSVPRVRREKKLVIEEEGVLQITQQPQVLNIGDFCNECGNCTTFCPTAGEPYRIKPRFYLTRDSYDAESDGYFLQDGELRFKSEGREEVLSRRDGEFVYQTPELTAVLHGSDLTVQQVRFTTTAAGPFSLRHGVQMAVLLEGLKDMAVFRGVKSEE
jgi:putative selenate reductase